MNLTLQLTDTEKMKKLTPFFLVAAGFLVPIVGTRASVRKEHKRQQQKLD